MPSPLGRALAVQQTTILQKHRVMDSLKPRRKFGGVIVYLRSATSMGVSLGLLKVRWKRIHLTRKA